YTKYDGEDLYAVALGSCVALVIYDPVIKVAALAHIALPDYRGSPTRVQVDSFDMPGRYADTAFPVMLQQLKRMGALRIRMKAKMAGGADIFGTRGILLGSVLNIGERNGKRIIELLRDNDIPLVGKDLGGDAARTVIFEANTQRMIVTNSELETKRIL
ncbi:MAG TPA: chemotaxis protein CheD, partial [Pseudodesulfovibrio sp.]|nr:chemotaxis protein CheD [Pseudodesulfovibrio sp.]